MPGDGPGDSGSDEAIEDLNPHEDSIEADVVEAFNQLVNSETEVNEESEPEQATLSDSEEKEKDVPAAEEKEDTPDPKETDAPEAIAPPNRFSAEQKQVFNKAPREVQEAVSQMVRDQEAHFTKKNQELSEKSTGVEDYQKAIQPYLKEWNVRGLTGPQAIAQLAASHQKLVDNPLESLAWLAESLGVQDHVTIEKDGKPVAPASSGQAAKTTQQNGASVDPALTNRLQALENKISQQEAQPVVEQLRSFRDTQDASGNYMYPELHDGNFLAKVKPLASAVAGNSPNLSYVEAFKQAYTALTGRVVASRDSVQPAGLPENNNRERAERAKVSVRGRGARPQKSVSSGDIPDNIEETVSLAWSMLSE